MVSALPAAEILGHQGLVAMSTAAMISTVPSASENPWTLKVPYSPMALR
jgi:hypothetical protein